MNTTLSDFIRIIQSINNNMLYWYLLVKKICIIGSLDIGYYFEQITQGSYQKTNSIE